MSAMRESTGRRSASAPPGAPAAKAAGESPRIARPCSIGAPLLRLDGPAKVTGTARYAADHPLPDRLHAHLVESTIARGRIVAIDDAMARALPGVVAVATYQNAPRLASDEDRELWILQSAEVAFRGQIVACVVAERPEVARHAASLVRLRYQQAAHDAEFRAGRDDLYAPACVNPSFETDTDVGDVEAALASAAARVDETYSTPAEHNNPMEPHTTVALWSDDRLTLYDSTQGVHAVRTTLAKVLGLPDERIRVVAHHVGGGFGSKGTPHAHDVAAALAARVAAGRPVALALTRRQMFALAGYRTPTVQRIRLGATRDGRLTALVHEVVEQTSRIKEFAEQTAVPSRMMYATPNRRTSHRLAALDVAVPSWMRAPGEEPGMFAGETAMDELAVACGVDPIELRVGNEPSVDPESGRPWSGRNLVGCLREGARRFGWQRRDPRPRAAATGRWLVGSGVASSTYPRYMIPGSKAEIRFDGAYLVRIGAVDIGTGTWTALAQIAADALGCDVGAVRLEIGDSDLPAASVEGGSSGISSWGATIVAAAEAFRRAHGSRPRHGAEGSAGMPKDTASERLAMHSFGAQFAEVRVDADSGEVRVDRLLGVFSVGRIINPATARSQLIGGMTMGLSAALHEASTVDPRFGHVVNRDLAGYHFAAHADVRDVEAVWLDECDANSNPMGSRGIGEIGIVGTAAAIGNAVYHATGIRVRDLPITPDKLLSGP